MRSTINSTVCTPHPRCNTTTATTSINTTTTSTTSPTSTPPTSPTPPSHPTTTKAPIVAESPTPLLLLDLISGLQIPFIVDTGARVTVIAEHAAKELHLTVLPPSSFVGIHLVTASASPITIVGEVHLELLIHKAHIVSVKAAVIPTASSDFLLGQNVLDIITKAHGNPFAWTDSASIPAPQLHSSPAFLTSALREPVRTSKNPTRSELTAQVCAWLPDSQLVHAGKRVTIINGYFEGAGRDFVLFANCHCSGTVDWSSPPDPRHRHHRPVRFLVRALGLGGNTNTRWSIQPGSLIGQFHPGFVKSTPTSVSVDAVIDHQTESCVDSLLATAELVKTALDKRKAREALSKFQFAEELPAAGRSSAEPFVISLTPGTTPVARRNYPLSHAQEEFAMAQISSWLKNGTIVASSSPWASPIVIATHPRTGKLRFCLDYRGLNARTVPDSYVMPRIEQLVRAVQGCVVFSKVDLTQGFNQIPMDQKTAAMTAFRGPRGALYEFAGAPFGLRNLPAAFQRMMDRVLGDMAWISASVYLDDVIIFSKSLSDHHDHLSQLAARLRTHNLFARASKCTFYQSQVEYLGYIIGSNSLRVMPDRVEKILNCPPPTSRQELRRFLGLTGQFRDMVFDYATIAAPLEAMKNPNSKTPFDLSGASPGHAAFLRLRQALADMPQLSLPDMHRPFIGYSDASDVAMAFVLSQKDESGLERPIAFYSKTFTPKQRESLTIPLKEAHALHYFCTKKAWPFLATGGPHKIFTDATGANALFKDSLQDASLRRLANDLQPLPLDITPISGSSNPADPLTRPPFVTRDPNLDDIAAQVSPLHDHPGWRRVQEIAVSFIGPNLPISEEQFQEAATADQTIAEISDFINTGRPAPPPNSSDEDRRHHRLLSEASAGLTISETGTLQRTTLLDGQPHHQRYIPTSLRQPLLDVAHAHGPTVHAGRNGLAMFEELRRFAYWPKMRSNCLAYECATCATNKKDHTKHPGLLHPLTAKRPGERVSMDFVPMPKADGMIGFYLLIDKFSGFVYCRCTKQDNSAEAIQAVEDLRQLLVDIEHLHTDSDSSFLSATFRQALTLRGIEHHSSFPYHQQANFVERSVQFVKQLLRTSLDGVPTSYWSRVLMDVVRYSNMMPHASQGVSPQEILTGISPPNLLPYADTIGFENLKALFNSREQLRDRVAAAMDIATQTQREQYNVSHSDRRFSVGSLVLVRRHTSPAGEGSFNLHTPFHPNPWRITHVLSEVSYIAHPTENAATGSKVFHISDLKRAVLEQDDPRNHPEQLQDEEWVIQRILDHRVRQGQEEYRVEWMGYNDVRHNSWEPAALLEHSQELLDKFRRLQQLNSHRPKRWHLNN